MSGHSKWSQIKHQKGDADQKRGRLFSKLVAAISVAATIGPNPQFNPRLRAAIEKAKAHNVPQENVLRAIARASEKKAGLAELVFEAYGPGGVPILIEAISDNRNRTVQEVKKIISDHGGRWADTGSVRWAFEHNEETRIWRAKFPQEVSAHDGAALKALLAALEDQQDIQTIVSGASSFGTQ